jgi:archaemetzincin
MNAKTFIVVILMTIGLISWCAHGEEILSMADLEKVIEKLRPLHRKMAPTKPGDWLSVHREPGQTFRQYVNSGPVLPHGKRKVICIQPLGDFDPSQEKVIFLTADFISQFYNRPVRQEKRLPLSVVPKEARRVHPSWGDKQILTGYVLQDILLERLPADASAYIAFTSSDLWPGQGWNFVFGQASLRKRVGVWSLYRYGVPSASDESFLLCSRRTMKTGVHELGHMLGMLHCTAYKCGMNGSNSLAESDRRPLWFCPECVAKVCWATGVDPRDRFTKLAEFCSANGLQKEAEHYEASRKSLLPNTPPKVSGGVWRKP